MCFLFSFFCSFFQFDTVDNQLYLTARHSTLIQTIPSISTLCADLLATFASLNNPNYLAIRPEPPSGASSSTSHKGRNNEQSTCRAPTQRSKTGWSRPPRRRRQVRPTLYQFPAPNAKAAVLSIATGDSEIGRSCPHMIPRFAHFTSSSKTQSDGFPTTGV
jgi:hypothetical protein